MVFVGAELFSSEGDRERLKECGLNLIWYFVWYFILLPMTQVDNEEMELFL